MSVSTIPSFLPADVQPGKTDAAFRHQQSMTVQHARGLAPCRTDGPPLDVQAWRRCRLIEAGFPAREAAWLAADPRFDLHALLELVDRGCPPLVAIRIVAPLRVGELP